MIQIKDFFYYSLRNRMYKLQGLLFLPSSYFLNSSLSTYYVYHQLAPIEILSWRVVDVEEIAELFLELLIQGGSTPTLGFLDGGSCSSLPPFASNMASISGWSYRRASLKGVQPL